MWLGLVAVELVLSPKFQEREAMLPSLSLELSVKLAVRPEVVKPKLATGGTLAGAVTVTDLVTALLAPPLSVTVSVTL